ncbi:hypothetical protein [Streptosporangium sp. NPDC000396]|uniref:LppU/SCO3897 family protein n=1 Tax=Streptosporangium sp. NPDC000396 TaxID=3366185 RepID=UPI00369AC621
MGGTVALAVTLIAAALLALDLVAEHAAGSLPKEISAGYGIPSDAKPGDCLKDGKHDDYEMVACTDMTAVWKITRTFSGMTKGAFDAKMANGGDICSEGETTTASYSGESANTEAAVYCLARPATALAKKQAALEAEELRDPSGAQLNAAIGDCLTSGTDMSYKVVACTDAAARWKVTKKVEGMARSEFESPKDGGVVCKSGERAVSQWDDEHNQAQIDVFCIASIN